jgi:hypothetical protein
MNYEVYLGLYECAIQEFLREDPGKMKRRDHLKELGVDGRIILE